MTSVVHLKKTDTAKIVTTVTASLQNACIQENTVYEFIDTPVKLVSVLDSIYGSPSSPPSLYIDLEGENLCRHGTISIMQLFILPAEQAYLIDIYLLGDSAFNTASTNGSTLKAVLESDNIQKVFFDVRNDSDALYSLYKISLRGVQDLQLMELATRPLASRFINGLAKCIEKDLRLPTKEQAAWKDAKEKGVRLFAPERGGSYAVFNQRPLSEDIKLYCIQDVKFLPRLWLNYDKRLTSQKREKMLVFSLQRITESQSREYKPHGRQKALIPSGWSMY